MVIQTISSILYWRSGNLVNKGNYKKALKYINMALKVNPKNLRASNFRIGIMAELGLDTKKYSREDFIIRMKLGENDASYWSMKGSNLFDEKKYKESIKCFDKALKLDSSLWGCKRDKKKALKLLKKGKIRNEIDTFENKEM